MVGRIKLIVAIEDEIYLDRLCDYLETSHGRFSTQRFSSKDAFTNALKSEIGYDAILFEHEMMDKRTIATNTKIKILLGEKESTELIDDCYSVKEYQKTDTIASSILNICTLDKRFMGIELRATNKAKLCVFTSPAGGSGVTTISLATAMLLAKQGKKTLYINLEQISSIKSFVPATGITMTQVTRMAIENNPKLLTAVEGGKSSDPLSGLEYFGGFSDVTDFDSLKPDHVSNLMFHLQSLGTYDIIIADVAWNSTLTTHIMEKAEKSFLVLRNTNLSVSKINQFLQYVNEKDISYRNRLYTVVNALNGKLNSTLLVKPIATISMNQMLIDTTNFSTEVLGNNAFCNSFAELINQFS